MRALALLFAIVLPAHAQGFAGSSLAAPVSSADLSTAIQAANVVTDGTGAWSVAWRRAFVSGSPIVTPLPVNTGALPILCNVASRTAAATTGKCWQATSTTLPGTAVAILGASVSPFATPAANTAVMVIGREPTQ